MIDQIESALNRKRSSHVLLARQNMYISPTCLIRLRLLGALAAVLFFFALPWMTPAAHATSTYTVLHNFGDNTVANDGAYSYSALVQASNGLFYGTTAFGGAHEKGTVFSVTSQGTVTILYSFQGTDGSYPETALTIGPDGNLYGTTSTGGTAGYGTFFEITTAGAFTSLHSFGDGAVQSDGNVPLASLLLANDGNFYSTTQMGGAYGDGTVYEITTAGTVTILHSFNGASTTIDGSNPVAGLVQGKDGNLYGTTSAGGTANNGTVYSITTAGAETVLHWFGSKAGDGANPNAALIQGTDGYFYGTTSAGGTTATSSTAVGDGTVFRISNTGVIAILHNFGDGTITNDGQNPAAALYQATNGDFYSTTVLGGLNGLGTIYQIASNGTVTILHAFGGTKDGSNPEQGLLLGSDGNFYGTTSAGGTADVGTVYSTNFGFSAPAPTFLPGPGAYTGAQTVTITDALPLASIYYTTTGVAPTANSTLYTGPITVSTSENIEAIAVKSGYLNSTATLANYIIGQTVPAPTVTANGGTFSSPQTVTLSDTLTGASLYYTTDGTTPSVGPSPTFVPLGTTTQYTGSITVSSSESINVIAVAAGYFPSAVTQASFTINVPSPTPVISPNGGRFTTAQTVTITDAGAAIYYTTDGNTPVRGAGDTLPYTAPFDLSALNTTVEAIGFAPNDVQSATATATFTIGTQLPPPTFSPVAGPYTSTQNVTITDPGATIYYTLDGSIPTTASSVYTTAIPVSSSETINAYATEAGHFDSPVVSAAYTIGLTVPSPVLSVPAGAYAAAQSVTVTDALVGTSIYYTLDGTTPTYNSNGPLGTTQLYSGPIAIAASGATSNTSATTQLNVIAAFSGYNDSNEVSATYVIGQSVPSPTVNPAAGPYTTAQSVVLSDSLGSATIYYTIDGSKPTTTSPKYTKPIVINSSLTINAMAVYTGYNNSPEVSFSYIIGGTVPTPAITPDGGPYATNQTVTLSDTLAGATILYTTDASSPAPSWTTYTVPFPVPGTGTITLTVVASESGYVPSTTTSATFTIENQAASPVLSVPAGTYSTAQTVTITDANPKAAIFYTTDGSTPAITSSGTGAGTTLLYSGPLTIGTTEVLSAIAYVPSNLLSAPTSALYNINIPLASPTFSPAGGNYSTAQTVTISDAVAGATIYYSTNASSSTPTWYQYSKPLSVTGTETITAKADLAGSTESLPTSATYTITQSLAAGLQLFSLPYTYAGIDVDTIFGYSGVKLAVWNPLTAVYSVTPTAPANQIVAGQGYWGRFPQAVNVTIAGTPAPTNTPFIIQLEPGWNMIGDPFAATIAISSLKFNDGTETYAQASSGTSPLIDPTFYSYGAGATSYSTASSLQADQGYWVFAYSATDLDVPVPTN
jgi:uncharacterized repeat protein (TIGR03803 family)